MKGSRGVRGASYTLITPENHYPSRLPEYGDAPVVKLVTPRLAPARIGEYLIALPPGGGTAHPVEPGFETFCYVLHGAARIGVEGLADTELRAGGYAYVPGLASWALSTGDSGARVLVVKREYEPFPGHPAPGVVTGHRDDEPFADTPVQGFRRRELLPTDDPAYDFAMSLLAFEPGVGLDNIEIHDEEHGLYMTAGEGRYFLAGEVHDVRQGDFIYMAPYCPQGFTATGGGPAEYLLYKDTWRDGFGTGLG